MTKLNVTGKHAEHGELKTVVDVGSDDEFHYRYAEIAESARKKFASRFVDYESFGSDSEYMNRLDAVASEFTITGVESASEQQRVRYHIYGRYSDDEGGTWSDHVWAVDTAEADLIARQTMAENEYGGEAGAGREDEASFQDTMEEIEIHDCYPEPVTKAEAVVMLSKLYVGITGMIEGGRLKESDIPDDFSWLTAQLEEIATKIDAPAKEAVN